MRILLDKIASSTRNLHIPREARLSTVIPATPGTVVAGRLHGDKSTYNQLEDVHGRMVPLHDADIVAGVLGPRNALLGYAGVVPDSVEIGDRLQLLNLGGVVGQCTSVNPDLGPPFDFEVLGSVLTFPEFQDRCGTPAHIGMKALRAELDSRAAEVPVIYLAGTCMNSGKTTTACKLIRALSQAGLQVGGCKLTGVSLLRDVLAMRDHGADHAVYFNDAGVVTTGPDNAVAVARCLLAHLVDCNVDVVVAELGDGIAGEYGVQEILSDRELRGLTGAFVLCANDPVGAWGAQRMLAENWGIGIDVVCGPATDNAVGTRYITTTLGCAALNARRNPNELGEHVLAQVRTPLAGKKSA